MISAWFSIFNIANCVFAGAWEEELMVYDDSINSESHENVAPASRNTGLGVFAILQKLQLWSDLEFHPSFTTLWVSSDEIAQWQREQTSRARSERRERRKSSIGFEEDRHPLDSMHGSLGPLENQQRDIRSDW